MHVDEIFTKRLSHNIYCDLIRVNYAVVSAIEADVFGALPEDMRDQLEVKNRTKVPALKKRPGIPWFIGPGNLASAKTDL